MDGASDCTQLARLAPPCTLPMRRFMTGKEKALLEDADAHRPPTPDPFEGEGSIWIQVTLRTLSGDVLETTAFRSHESDDRALGSLVGMGKKFENEGCDYCYHLLLDKGKSINCREKRYPPRPCGG